MGGGNFTLYGVASSGSGASANSYIQDNFQDVSNPPSANTGLTSNSNTNPLSLFFQNDDSPRYGMKTLWIKDLVLIQDRSSWLNNKPTYRIVWDNPDDAVQGYAYGNVRLRNLNNGISVDINNIGDAIAVNGVIRQVMWLVNPSTQATATAELFNDGVDQSSTIDFSNLNTASSVNGVNHYTGLLHNSSQLSYDLHDFRIVANQYRNLKVAGVVVFFQNATSNIDAFPGSTYVNRQKYTTTSTVALALPTLTGKVGADTAIAKTTANTYALTTIENGYINTIAQGSSGTNLMTVTTGQGSSFPVGSGIVGSFGSSFYVGSVTGVSTDTLTIFPTLAFGVSGLLYKEWNAGPTFAINASMFGLWQQFDPQISNVTNDANGFGVSLTGNYYYSPNDLSFRAWGFGLQQATIEGFQGINFQGATQGFLQIDGLFSAVDMEIAAAGVMHGTLSVNGVPVWGINEGASGILRKTIFTDSGPGWNSVLFSVGSSFSNCAFTRFNLYQRKSPIGVTQGLLAHFPSHVNEVTRFGDVQNATMMALGGWQRTYSDSLFLQGAWARGVTYSAAGGVLYYGTSTNSKLLFQWYGSDYSIIGTAGSSAVVTIDGNSTAINLNARSSAAIGFHSVVYQHQSGTSIINAFDFMRPQNSELKNLQQYLPSNAFNTGPKIYAQSDTPRNPRDLDIWANDKYKQSIWIYLFGRWNQITISNTSDDPNAGDLVFLTSHGTIAGLAAASALNSMETYNFSSWVAGPASPVNRYIAQSSEGIFNSKFYYIDGSNASGTVTLTNVSTNKFSWTTNTNRNTANIYGALSKLSGFLVVQKGSTNGVAGNVTTQIDEYNGSSWLNAAGNYQTASQQLGSFSYGNTVHCVGGELAGGSNTNEHDIWNGTSAVTSTAYPTSDVSLGGSPQGGAGWAGALTTTASYVWNGSWSSSIVMTYLTNSQAAGAAGGGPSSGGNNNNLKAYVAGGNPSTTTVTAAAASLNGTSWIVETSETTARSACAGGCL